MIDPIFWLGVSILLVAVSLTAVLIAALPALQELARAARSAEKLFDTLSRELPPTLDSIRLASIEITNLTDDVNQNVQAAGRVVEQFDQSLTGVKQQAQQAQITTRSVMTGVKAAWQNWRRPQLDRLDFSDHSLTEATSNLAASNLTASNLTASNLDMALPLDRSSESELDAETLLSETRLGEARPEFDRSSTEQVLYNPRLEQRTYFADLHRRDRHPRE